MYHLRQKIPRLTNARRSQRKYGNKRHAGERATNPDGSADDPNDLDCLRAQRVGMAHKGKNRDRTPKGRRTES